MAGRQSNKLNAIAVKYGVTTDYDGTDVFTDKSLEDFLEFTRFDHRLDTQLHPETGRRSL